MNAINIVDAYAFYLALKDSAKVNTLTENNEDKNELPNLVIYKQDNTLYLNLEDKIVEPLDIINLMKKYTDVNKVIINSGVMIDYNTPDNYLNALNSAEEKIKNYYYAKASVFTKIFKFINDKILAQFISTVYALVKSFIDLSKHVISLVFKVLKNIGGYGAKLLRSAINMIKQETYIVTEQDTSKNVADTLVYIRLNVDKEISENQLFNSILNIQIQDLDANTILTKTLVINKFDKIYTINMPENFQIIKIFIAGAPFDLDIIHDYNNKSRFLNIDIRRHSRLISLSMVQDVFITTAFIVIYAAVLGFVFDFGILTALGYGPETLLNESLLYGLYAFAIRTVLSSAIITGIIVAFLRLNEIKKFIRQVLSIHEHETVLKVIEEQDEDRLRRFEKKFRDKAKERIKARHYNRHKHRR